MLSPSLLEEARHLYQLRLEALRLQEYETACELAVLCHKVLEELMPQYQDDPYFVGFWQIVSDAPAQESLGESLAVGQPE